MTGPASSTAKPCSGRARLLVVLTTAGIVVALAEWGSSRVIPPDLAPEAIGRPENVIWIPRLPAELPMDRGGASVWMLGNSHTFALPGLKPDDELRTELSGIVIDRLSMKLTAKYPGVQTNLYLLAYPNFLPFEMLTRVGQMLERGQRPKVVFLGLTFANLARDSRLRHEVYLTYREPGFADAFEAMLVDPTVHADGEILEEVGAQRRRAEHDQEAERLRSDADRLDEQLVTWAAKRLTLIGKSSALRAQAMRKLMGGIQQKWADRQGTKYSYDLIEHDFAFNVKCLKALLRLLKQTGAEVLCYYAPERTDLPLMIDPVRQEAFMAAFNRDAQELGIPVLDARGLVPNEYWGWVEGAPDRSHFTEPGHERLAEFLLEEAEKRSVWKELTAP